MQAETQTQPLGSGHPLLSRYESGVEEYGLDPYHGALASIAISLRRMADSINGTDGCQSIADSIFYIEQKTYPQ